MDEFYRQPAQNDGCKTLTKNSKTARNWGNN